MLRNWSIHLFRIDKIWLCVHPCRSFHSLNGWWQRQSAFSCYRTTSFLVDTFSSVRFFWDFRFVCTFLIASEYAPPNSWFLIVYLGTKFILLTVFSALMIFVLSLILLLLVNIFLQLKQIFFKVPKRFFPHSLSTFFQNFLLILSFFTVTIHSSIPLTYR